jgi:hypothetical protein
MNENEGYWGGGISIISQNFPKSPYIHLIPPFPKQALMVVPDRQGLQWVVTLCMVGYDVAPGEPREMTSGYQLYNLYRII